MKQIRISLDLDGVCWNLMKSWLGIYNLMYPNKQKKYEDICCWDFFKVWGFPDEKTVYDIFHMINLKDVEEIDPRISQYLTLINKTVPYSIDIVSSRRPETRKEVEQKLGSMYIEKYHQYKNLIMIPYEPYDAKAYLDYDIYIDDSAELANTIKDMPNKTQILFNRPWNLRSNFSAYKNIIRINYWNEVLKYL